MSSFSETVLGSSVCDATVLEPLSTSLRVGRTGPRHRIKLFLSLTFLISADYAGPALAASLVL